uniref:Uncharacterized protein n=1 Tax=Salix viminalis TaxID=40686 RepID=A0A6N2LMQ9_SALVM
MEPKKYELCTRCLQHNKLVDDMLIGPASSKYSHRFSIVINNYLSMALRQEVMVVLHDIMDNHESMDKATWTREMLHIFCDICIKAIDMGMRPNTYFDRCG